MLNETMETMMGKTPILSICVPSRNRQFYFKKTIEGLLANRRADVEFVLTDNSDDPSEMNVFMQAYKDDPRVVYLPSTDQTLPMIDNWERTVAAATGEWVTVIGDDDHADPDIADILARATLANPDLDAFSWGVAAYTWPGKDSRTHSVFVPFNSFVVKVPRNEPYRRMFGWYGANAVPTSGFSIYHSAVRRPLLEKIRVANGGSYFEHPVVDYDMAMKVIVNGKHFAFCQRVLSIMGSCPLSNSYGTTRLADARKKLDDFFAELGRNSDEENANRNFPFDSSMGVTAAIGVVQQWYRDKYGLDYSSWEKDFVKACVTNTESFSDAEEFELVRSGYAAAIARWKGGRYRHVYNPQYRPRVHDEVLCGSSSLGLYMRSDIAGAETPKAIYDIICDMSVPVEMIDIPADGLKSPFEQVMLTADGTSRTVQVNQRRVA